MIIWKCRQCGAIVYVYSYRKDYFGVPMVGELKERVARKCPRCGREFTRPSVNDILIKKAWIKPIRKRRKNG